MGAGMPPHWVELNTSGTTQCRRKYSPKYPIAHLWLYQSAVKLALSGHKNLHGRRTAIAIMRLAAAELPRFTNVVCIAVDYIPGMRSAVNSGSGVPKPRVQS